MKRFAGLLFMAGLAIAGCGGEPPLTESEAQAIVDYVDETRATSSVGLSEEDLLRVDLVLTMVKRSDFSAGENRARCDAMIESWKALPSVPSDLPTKFVEAVDEDRRARTAWLDRCNPLVDIIQEVDHGETEAEERRDAIVCEAQTVLGLSCRSE